MDFSGWNHLQHHTDEGPFISASDITGPDRALLFGYDVDRNDFSVELVGKGTGILVDHGERYETRERWPVSALYPNKRVYASETDLSFAMLLKRNGGTPTYINIPKED